MMSSSFTFFSLKFVFILDASVWKQLAVWLGTHTNKKGKEIPATKVLIDTADGLIFLTVRINYGSHTAFI